jgi:CelD/BcsL family acetyltransferase involved in cellulose biosynthesis
VDIDVALPILETIPWEVALLSGVAREATNVPRLAEAFAKRGFAVRRTALDACPYLDLPDTWDRYLEGLPSAKRQSLRRTERKLMRDHGMKVTDYASDERLEDGWAILRELHEERWSGPGALGNPQIDTLLREFSRALARKGELWLTTLDLDDKPAAAWYGFAWLDTVYFYQGGRDPKWESQSVGKALMTAMIRRAIERGYRRFDFLRGRDRYKYSWTSTERVIDEVVVFRPGLRGAWLRGLDFVGRARARVQSKAEFAGIGD